MRIAAFFLAFFTCFQVHAQSCSAPVPAADWRCTDAGIFDLDLGDANGDGAVDYSDVSTITNYLFQGGPEPACWEEADVNNDGCLNLTDAIRLSNYLSEGDPLEFPDFYLIPVPGGPTLVVRGFCETDEFNGCPEDVTPGDANLDGQITFADLAFLADFVDDPSSYANSPPCFEWLDVNGDDHVDQDDVDHLEDWLIGAGPAPEPPHDACWDDGPF